MTGETDVKLGRKLTEGKTKVIYELVNIPGCVLIESKDRITAGDGARAHDLQGKAAISTTTTSAVFSLLNNSGIRTHFLRLHNELAFIANRCHMIPIEFVARRIASGSFLKRNPGVGEGYRFRPLKIEYFYKDDAKNDPQWSSEQIVEAHMKCGGIEIGWEELDIMSKTTNCVFEILERAWASQDCALIDMKIEFGIDSETKEVLLADVIDSDSWRLWPSGDRRLMKDKQVYRELKEVTPKALETVKSNFTWIAEKVLLLQPVPTSRVVVFMGSPVDLKHSEKIQEVCKSFGIPCELRVTSAHKSTDAALQMLAEYEGDGISTVIIAAAGRSNALGPVLSANTVMPVINCPPIKAEWGPEDIWSSLRLPSGIGCSTVMSPEAAALQAAQILALQDHMIWAKLRANQLNTWVNLRKSDRKIRESTRQSQISLQNGQKMSIKVDNK